MTHLVLLNGPPGCGKDTLASNLVPYLKFTHLKFAAPIKRMAAGLLNVDQRYIESFKEKEVSGLRHADGLTKDTLRQFLIALSEDFMKPRYGDEIFGHLLWQEAKNAANKLVVVSDCGFAGEVHRVIRNAGKANCLVVRIHRDGHTFTGDSRSYLPDNLCDTVDLYNDKHAHWLTMIGLRVIMKKFPVEFIKEPEWLRGI